MVYRGVTGTCAMYRALDINTTAPGQGQAEGLESLHNGVHISTAFGIRKSAEELRAQAGGMHVTLSTSGAFASFWMMPRLQKFRDDLPGIDLRIQTADRDLDLGVFFLDPLGGIDVPAKDWRHNGCIATLPSGFTSPTSTRHMRQLATTLSSGCQQ